MNFFNKKKNQKKIAAVICFILALAMIITFVPIF